MNGDWFLVIFWDGWLFIEDNFPLLNITYDNLIYKVVGCESAVQLDSQI